MMSRSFDDHINLRSHRMVQPGHRMAGFFVG